MLTMQCTVLTNIEKGRPSDKVWELRANINKLNLVSKLLKEAVGGKGMARNSMLFQFHNNKLM